MVTISPEAHSATETTNLLITQHEAEARAAIAEAECAKLLARLPPSSIKPRYQPAATQGILAARQVLDAIERAWG